MTGVIRALPFGRWIWKANGKGGSAPTRTKAVEAMRQALAT